RETETRVNHGVRPLRDREGELVRKHGRVDEACIGGGNRKWNGTDGRSGKGWQSARRGVVAARAVGALDSGRGIGAAVVKHAIADAQHAAPITTLGKLISDADPRGKVGPPGLVGRRTERQ